MWFKKEKQKKQKQEEQQQETQQQENHKHEEQEPIQQKSNNQKPKGEFQIIEHQGKVLTVYRRCSCGGDVEITIDKETGRKTAVCKSCGNTLSWGGDEN